MNVNWSAELAKVLSSVAVALVTLSAGWIVGQRLSFRWNIRQKQREFFLAATNQFHAAYGEFFAVWKLWNRLDPDDHEFATKRWELLQRAAKAEATTESILLKIVTELRVSEKEAEDLGRFRQAFQSLRQSIRDSKPLDWNSSEDPRYAAFKRLSCETALLLQEHKQDEPPGLDHATKNHRTATSNRWENNWWDIPNE